MIVNDCFVDQEHTMYSTEKCKRYCVTLFC